MNYIFVAKKSGFGKEMTIYPIYLIEKDRLSLEGDMNDIFVATKGGFGKEMTIYLIYPIYLTFLIDYHNRTI